MAVPAAKRVLQWGLGESGEGREEVWVVGEEWEREGRVRGGRSGWSWSWEKGKKGKRRG